MADPTVTAPNGDQDRVTDSAAQKAPGVNCTHCGAVMVSLYQCPSCSRPDVLDSPLREAVERAIYDEAATYEQQFDAGPGDVVGVPDAALVATRACYRWLLARGIDLAEMGV